MLLSCGVLASLLYVAMNVFVPMRWASYSSVSQTVSELSAIGAPTRSLWVLLGILYGLLVTAFGCGIWSSAGRNRPLLVAGGLVVADGILGMTWPPMHLREVLAAGGGTLTDTMHLVYSAATVLLMLLAIGFAAAALGKNFRIYSIVTMVVLMGFGVLTSIEAPHVSANLPTPWIGVWERIGIAGYMVWAAVLAMALLRGVRATKLRKRG